MYDFWSTVITWALFIILIRYKTWLIGEKLENRFQKYIVSNPQSYNISPIVFEKYKKILEFCEKNHNVTKKSESSLNLYFCFQYHTKRPDRWKVAFLNELASSPENTMLKDMAKAIEILMDKEITLKVEFFTRHVIWRKGRNYLPTQEIFYRISVSDPLVSYIYNKKILDTEEEDLVYTNLPYFLENDGIEFADEQYKDFDNSIVEETENEVFWDCRRLIRNVTDKFGIVSLYV